MNGIQEFEIEGGAAEANKKTSRFFEKKKKKGQIQYDKRGFVFFFFFFFLQRQKITTKLPLFLTRVKMGWGGVTEKKNKQKKSSPYKLPTTFFDAERQ